jgi:hypothetical protein
MMPQYLQSIAIEKVREVEAELRRDKWLAQFPQQPPPWRIWVGKAVGILGIWFTSWGKWVAQSEHKQDLAVTNQ